jgi:pimeloyl-ACP methyl ester carboxylesterase
MAAGALFVLVVIALGGAYAGMTRHAPERGRMVDIGGRSLRIVCEGPKDGRFPTAVLEAGAFGFSADWAEVQAQLTTRGIHSCAYDRAGLGYSDAGPSPRDGTAVAADLEALLRAADEPGPYVLVGHSMAGLSVRIFAARNAAQVRGVVLIDAATPEASADPRFAQFIETFGHIADGAAWASRWGLLNVFSPFGDTIGVSGEASAEKRRMLGASGHNRWAAEEARNWQRTAAQARASAPFDPEIPVAVILAGAGPQDGLDGPRETPARASRHGFVEHVAGATHATLLGRSYAPGIARAVERVISGQGMG